MISAFLPIKYAVQGTLFAVSLLMMCAASATNVIFEYAFNPSGPTIPIRDYANRSQSDYFYTPQDSTWNMGYSRIAGKWKNWGSGAVDTQQFIYRNLRDGQIIPDKVFAEDLSVTINTRWLWGAPSAIYETYIGLLDEAGNGYTAVYKRNGEVGFYAISAPGVWTELGSAVPLSVSQGANEGVALVFSVRENRLELTATKGSATDTAVYPLPFAEQRYLHLSELFIGASQGGDEEIIISRISVSAESQTSLLTDYTFPAVNTSIPVQTESQKELSDHFFADREGSWSFGYGRLRGVWKSWGDNPAPRQQFLFRNLRDSGDLAEGSYLPSPAMGIETRWVWGKAQDSYVTYLGFLDEDGNGHVASITRTGDVNFYEVTASGTWYAQGESIPLNLSQESAERFRLRFRVNPAGLELFASNGTDVRYATHRFSDGDNRHLKLTTMMLGAAQGSNEEILIDRLYVSSTPESGTLFNHTFVTGGPVETIRTYAEREDSGYIFSSQEGLWNQGYNRIAGRWKNWGEGAVDRTQFIYRDLRDGIIGIDEASPVSPVLTVSSRWAWGAATATEKTHLGFLDSNGDGYAVRSASIPLQTMIHGRRLVPCRRFPSLRMRM